MNYEKLHREVDNRLVAKVGETQLKNYTQQVKMLPDQQRSNDACFSPFSAIEMLESFTESPVNVEQPLRHASTTVLKEDGAYGARKNVAKAVVAVLGSPMAHGGTTAAQEIAEEILARPHLVSVAVGYGGAVQV